MTRPPGRRRTWTYQNLMFTNFTTGTIGEILRICSTQTHNWFANCACCFQRANDGRGGKTWKEDKSEGTSETAWQTSWKPCGWCKSAKGIARNATWAVNAVHNSAVFLHLHSVPVSLKDMFYIWKAFKICLILKQPLNVRCLYQFCKRNYQRNFYQLTILIQIIIHIVNI